MSAVVLLGAQWGDEGKGKITDYLAEKADLVVRYQGGSNAGHTVEVASEKFMLHLIPSGILYPDKISVIGNGVVIDISKLVEELESLHRRGVNTSNLRISTRAHVVMPYHKAIDEIEDQCQGIGTTRRGIGPAYADKIHRSGFRVSDVLYDSAFRERFQAEVERKNQIIHDLYGRHPFQAGPMFDELMSQAEKIREYVVDTSLLVYNAIQDNKKVLFEGAQGTLLDIDHGTYPYVTSSHPTAGGACTGSGVGPTSINRVLGVAKAYTTRVGEGPFPSELNDATGDLLRERGAEYGTTTGRKRRCGWLDTVILRYAARINGLTDLAITKLDVLDGFETVKICVGYWYEGSLLQDFPENISVLRQCVPEFLEMPGWQKDTTGITCYEDLPPQARSYIEKVEEIVGVRHAIVAVGPKRAQTICSRSLFQGSMD